MISVLILYFKNRITDYDNKMLFYKKNKNICNINFNYLREYNVLFNYFHIFNKMIQYH